MRRKQLYAIILAGALATGGAPITAMAADAAAEAGASEETGDLGSGDTTEAPQEEAPTEAPAQEVTEAPADNTADAAAEQTEAPAQQQDTTETPQDVTETPQEPTGIAITKGENTTYYKTLKEAVDAADPYSAENKEATVIQISTAVPLSDTVDVSGKNVCIYATDDASISRESDSFKGDMFKVSGENSTLRFATAEGKTLTVTGKLTDGQTAEGSIVNVSSKAIFGLGANVTLTENTSSANGAAINSTDNGNIILEGGTITGNTGVKGAVYSDSNICVQGTVKVKDNKIQDAQANVYLDGEAQFAVTDALTDSEIFFTHANAADGTQVLAAAENVDADTFKSSVSQFSYDTVDFSLNIDETNKTATLKTATPSTSPEPSAAPSQGPTATPTKAPTVTPTKTPSFLTYKSGTLKWENHTTVSLKMSVTKDCKWYYFYVDSGTSTNAIQNMYDASRATNSAKANTEFTVTGENVPEADTWLVVCAKPTSGKAQMRVFKLDSTSFKNKRPAAANTSTRAARTHKVTESTVSGLEEPLKFTPGTFYEFTVTGAGMNDKSPYVSGDERWIPMYWSTYENPTSSQKNTTFRIGSGKGIMEAKTYNMYIFFKKQIYNGSEWQDTDVIESITTQFKSQELTDADLTVTPSGSADGGNGGSGSGSATDAELTATEAASEKADGSSSKSAVSTLDESPIGTMVALAALSLLAGGYILIRKRKKDI